MIDELLDIIKEEADTFLKLKMKDTSQEQYVKLVPIVDQDGKPAVVENSVMMTLVKIEEDRDDTSNSRTVNVTGEVVQYSNPPIKLNLYVLFSGSYIDGQEKNYKEVLKRLSLIIAFFQTKNVFTSRNTPKMDQRFGRIAVDMINQTFEQQNNLWGMFGNTYRPSVLMRLRVLKLSEAQINAVGETVGDKQIEHEIG